MANNNKMNILEAIKQLRDDLKLWVANNLRTKVDKEDGKGLSSNDFTKADQDKLNEVDNKLSLTGGTMSGNIDMGNKAITNIATPENNSDAVNKKYVDNKVTPFVITVDENGIADKTGKEVHEAFFNGNVLTVNQTITTSFNGIVLTTYKEYEYTGNNIDDFLTETATAFYYNFSCVSENIIYNCKVEGATVDNEDVVTCAFTTIDLEATLDTKMDKENPTGTGSFSLNRKNGSTIGEYSFAEGLDNEASGICSHAEGWKSKATGDYSHAEGHNAMAYGDSSHAEGDATLANSVCSHAEGFNTSARGYYSHTEGYYSTAWNTCSHAEGYDTDADGASSHSEGTATISSSKSQHVQGEYNIEDEVEDATARGKYAHIVGNGTADDARSNAHTLDWEGNAWFAGDIYVGGTGQDDETVKKVATEDYVANAISGFSNDIYHIGDSTNPPTNTKLLWIDTTASTGGLKYYNTTTSTWDYVPVAFT